MALSALSVLAGLGQGYEQNIAQGQKARQANADLELARAKVKEMQDAIDAEEAARKARGARPPSLTGVPQPAQPQQPGPQAPAPGGPPPAAMQPAGPPAPMPAPGPAGGPSAPAAPAMTQPTAQPAAGAPAAPTAPQSDPAAAFSPEAIQQRYATIYAGMKQANPDLNDEELNDAVGNYIEAQAKLAALAHPQAGIIIQEGRQAATERGQDIRQQTQERGQDLTYGAREDAIRASLQRQQWADATRLQAEQLVQAGANQRNQLVVAQRQAALDAGLDLKTWQTQMQAALKEQGMSDAFITSLFRSNAMSPGTAPGQPGGRAQAARSSVPLPAAPARKGAPLTPQLKSQYQAAQKAGNGAEAKRRLQSAGYDTTGL